MRFAAYGVVVIAVLTSLLLARAATRMAGSGRDRAARWLSWTGGAALTVLVVLGDAMLLKESAVDTIVSFGCLVGGGTLGCLYGRLRRPGSVDC